MAEPKDKNPLNLSDEDVDSFDWEAYDTSKEESEGNESEGDVETDVQEQDQNSAESNEQEVDQEVDTNTEVEVEVEEGLSEGNLEDKSETKEVSSQESSDTDVQDDSGEQTESNKDSKDTKIIPESDDVGDKPKSEGEDKTSDTNTDTDTELDYKQLYHDIIAPFKANGRMMQIENASDVRTLMQMGANYNKKMAGLKPSLKIVRMLENNDLLDEAKISRLIDLDKKDPDAIKQLIKDSKIDVMELDPEQEVNYKPNAYTVNDKEVEFDSTLKDIRDTESYSTTLNIISNKWDESSRQALYNSPDIVTVLNDHVASGIYDQVMDVVDRERILGRLTGLSDIEAYKQVGDALNAAGKFNKGNQQNTATNYNVSKATEKKVVDPKLKDKKRAASSTKTLASKSKGKAGFNPLNLSDSEFEKIAQEKYT